MDNRPVVEDACVGPHLVYRCVVDSSSPWAPGEYIGVTLTEEDCAVVHLSSELELIGVYDCSFIPTYVLDALQGRISLLWAAPVIRRMRQEELSRSLASVPRHMLEPPRLMA